MRGVPRVRGGHPEQREAGGGWGEPSGRAGAQGATPAGPPPAVAPGRPGFPGSQDPSATPGPTAPFGSFAAPGPSGPSRSSGPSRPSGPFRPPGPSRPSGPSGAAESPGAAGPPGASGLFGRSGSPGRSTRPRTPFPRQRQGAPGTARQGAPGSPRQEYLDAFGEEADDLFAARPPRRTPAPAQPSDPYSSVTDWSADAGSGTGGGGTASDADDAAPAGEPAPVRGGKGRTFTGIAAAAVTTVLAVVVAGQVADGPDGGDARSQAATDQARDVHDSASRADGRSTPSEPETAAPLTYEQKMDKTYPLGATLKGSGTFDAIPGIAKGPGKGQKYTYRVDVEQGLGLDGELFAEAVHRTLNDNRSWAHNGARSFERIHSGQPDFVITLASPGTTADWCAKSGLDTTEDNVSCDSAATERVMINAYRWAQGAEPYGDAIHAYRQMLINHEIGHRIGFNHVSCDKDGELAPVMQQQTKFIDHDGIDCRPNAWAYPNG
ncbi:DUF3152 domain-containing protein [Streptomyces ziwulingensis]